jgi:hypothetical protein
MKRTRSLAKLLPENYTNQQDQESNNGACDNALLVHSIDIIYIHLSGWISCKHCSARQQTYRRIIAFRVFDARSIEPSAVRSCQWPHSQYVSSVTGERFMCTVSLEFSICSLCVLKFSNMSAPWPSVSSAIRCESFKRFVPSSNN